MVLPICFEVWFRLVGHLLKFGWEHLLVSLIIIFAFGLLSRNGLLLMVASWVIENLEEASSLGIISFFGVIGNLLSIVFFGAPAPLIFAFLLGVLWLLLLWVSRFDIITKLVFSPLYFAFGAIWAIIPIPIIPLTAIIYLGISDTLYDWTFGALFGDNFIFRILLRYVFLLIPFVLFLFNFIPFLDINVCGIISETLKTFETVEYRGLAEGVWYGIKSIISGIF